MRKAAACISRLLSVLAWLLTVAEITYLLTHDSRPTEDPINGLVIASELASYTYWKLANYLTCQQQS